MGTQKTNPLRKARALANAVLTDSVAQLVDEFMFQVQVVADEEDWAESDDWVGRLILKRREGNEEHVYHIQDGQMVRSASEGPYIASLMMTVDSFLELMDAAMKGRGEEMFASLYGTSRIVFDGERWVADSERFRMVLKRMGAGRR